MPQLLPASALRMLFRWPWPWCSWHGSWRLGVGQGWRKGFLGLAQSVLPCQRCWLGAGSWLRSTGWPRTWGLLASLTYIDWRAGVRAHPPEVRPASSSFVLISYPWILCMLIFLVDRRKGISSGCCWGVVQQCRSEVVHGWPFQRLLTCQQPLVQWGQQTSHSLVPHRDKICCR